MSNVIIRVENLSKQYRLGTLNHGTLYRDLQSWWARKRGREDPNSRIGASNHSQSGNGNDSFWALKDVSFEVEKGEVVGIIGRNGAGKSTLLKILSRVTAPTTGEVNIKGRIASLLEVGTGFHPELTGRENIYLNGSILGMKKREIDAKFDEIVKFSEIEKFLDTPVKRYSSGMYVRLAFAVAAHLEPEILLVDEVLAVGDAAFQKKCLGKMGEVAKEGRTVLFVSHNMGAIRNLCDRTLLLDHGMLELDADTQFAIAKYLNQNLTEGAVIQTNEIERKMEGVIKRNNPSIRLKRVALLDQEGLPSNSFQSDERIKVCVTYECLTDVNDLKVIVMIVDEDNKSILTTLNDDDSNNLNFYHRKQGVYNSYCIIPPNTFGGRRYYVSVHLEYPKVEHLVLNKIIGFDVGFKGYNNFHGSFSDSLLRPQLSWQTQYIDSK